MLRVDLNCDLGEGLGAWRSGHDEELMALVTSANVACGMHAGDPGTMRRTVALARRHGVAIGAHPGLPDLVGMGRRSMAISPEEAYELTLYQIGALEAFVHAAGGRLQHVKAHGALYTMAAHDVALAGALAAATRDHRPDLVLVGLPGSAHERAADTVGVRFAAEVYADRTYQADGTLTPRWAGAVAFVEDPEVAAARVVAMVREGRIEAVSGESVAVRVDTVCLHGDAPHAVAIARSIRRALEEADVALLPLASKTP